MAYWEATSISRSNFENFSGKMFPKRLSQPFSLSFVLNLIWLLIVARPSPLIAAVLLHQTAWSSLGCLRVHIMRRILFTVWLVEKIQPLWQHSWLWCVLREKLLLCFVFFEKGFSVALTVLELTLQTSLASNLEIYLLCLPNSRVKDVCSAKVFLCLFICLFGC